MLLQAAVTSSCFSLAWSKHGGYVQSLETIKVTRKTKANFAFSCDSYRRRVANIPKTILKVSFDTTKMCFFFFFFFFFFCNQNYENAYWVDIINLTLYQIHKDWYHLFDLTASIIAVSHIINSRALTGEKRRVNKAIHALLMHGSRF